jgi:HD-GYP domain-containing protein (c-di-GMP phosphodiesterase class II)
VAETFARFGTGILDELGSRDVWEAVLEAEPEPRRTIGTEGLDGLARALADMVDLKSPFLLGHSSEVAALSERAAAALGFGPEAVTDLRRAALLRDLGRVAVSNGIWEKPAALSTTEWERVRLHPCPSERILARSRVWSRWPGRRGCTMSGRTAPATTEEPPVRRCPPLPGSWPPRTPSRP